MTASDLLSKRMLLKITRSNTYRFGALLNSPSDDGDRGSLLLFETISDASIEYFTFNVEFRTACCNNADLCNLYYERRPSDECFNYRRPFFSKYITSDATYMYA